MAYIIKGTTVISDAGAIDSAQSKIIANSSLALEEAIVYSPVQGSTSGYTSGGEIASLNYVNTIDKFPFAADGNATDVGDLTAPARRAAAGQSSAESGYTSGGQSPILNTIDKFPFAANANATDVGDLTQARAAPAGQSSDVSGYTSGGVTGPTYVNTIDKFPFAANANATDVGDLTQERVNVAGQSSDVSGYTSGGLDPGITPPPTLVNTIDKFPFATDANATDVGDLTQSRFGPAGQSSTESGYNSGGVLPAYANTIDKFSFAANANATDVGDLTQARLYAAGQQV